MASDFGFRPHLDHEDPKTEKLQLRSLFIIYHCKGPHPVVAVDDNDLELFIADPTINKVAF